MNTYVFEAFDPDGILVRLSQTVWEEKILSPTPIGHPEVKPYLDQIKEAISDPDLVFRSSRRHDVKIFYGLKVGVGEYAGLHLIVIVKYVVEEDGQMRGYISTTYLTRKIYSQGELLWKKPDLPSP